MVEASRVEMLLLGVGVTKKKKRKQRAMEEKEMCFILIST
jgi:hypothetical protein